MPTNTDRLLAIWSDLDRCEGCKDHRFANADAPRPGRPFQAPKTRPVLFMGEAPPPPGGLWKCRNGDNLRVRLFPSLPQWPADLDLDSAEALEHFIDLGYFFVQAMKWPLQHSSYGQLRREPQRLAFGHAVEAHLDEEVELLEPRAIVALGDAAWQACNVLTQRHGGVPSDLGVAEARGKHHQFLFAQGDAIPFHVTFLPGTTNERFTRGISGVIREDVGVFLECISGEWLCERAARKFWPFDLTAARGGRKGMTRSKALTPEDKDVLRRLKWARLWPPPPGRSWAEVLEELHRREHEGRLGT